MLQPDKDLTTTPPRGYLTSPGEITPRARKADIRPHAAPDVKPFVQNLQNNTKRFDAGKCIHQWVSKWVNYRRLTYCPKCNELKRK